MKKLLILFILWATPSCKPANVEDKMECVEHENGMFRCENSEAVCYRQYGYAPSCKFKEVTNETN